MDESVVVGKLSSDRNFESLDCIQDKKSQLPIKGISPPYVFKS